MRWKFNNPRAMKERRRVGDWGECTANRFPGMSPLRSNQKEQIEGKTALKTPRRVRLVGEA